MEMFVSMAVFVVVNAAITLLVARRWHSLNSSIAAFAGRVLVNVALVLTASWLLRRDDVNEGDINEATALFFVLLLCLITLLDDRYRPVHAVRVPHRSWITGHAVVPAGVRR
jgi:hypothetical protein